MAKNYYDILGVSREANKEEIKKAYKTLAKEYHPDLHKGDKEKEAKFKEINEAYKALYDDKSRANYDRFGSADSSNFGGGQDFSGYDFSEFGFGDIFEGIFGGGFRQRKRRGSDLITNLEITLQDAYRGAEKTIMVNKEETCSKCGGLGAESESDIVTCPSCGGSGFVRRTQRTPFGIFSTTIGCGKCGGTGKHIRTSCSVCDGTGIENKNKKINVKIPAGIAEGQRLRVPGEGSAGDYGMPAGDLYVEVSIKPHELFERKGDDLLISVPISFVQAVLGTEVEVPTLDGEVKLKVPEGTQSHTLFRLKGKGIPHLRGFGSGDEKVRVIVQVPEKLNKKQRELLEKFAEAGGDKIKPLKKGFFEKFF